jgi:hypothetical protein
MRLAVVMVIASLGCQSAPGPRESRVEPAKKSPTEPAIRTVPGVELVAASAECKAQKLVTLYARVGLGDGRESWSDVAVRAPVSEVVALCEDLAARVFPTQLAAQVQVLRGCDDERLPAVASPTPGLVLIQPVAGTLPVAVNTKGKVVQCVDRAVSHYTRGPTFEKCKLVRDHLREQDARARAQAGDAGRRWLESELEQAEKAKARECIEAVAVSKRCLPLEVTPADYERACKRKGKGYVADYTCEAIKERAIQHNLCSIEEARAKRSCQSAIERKRLLQDRLAEPAPPPHPVDYRCF